MYAYGERGVGSFDCLSLVCSNCNIVMQRDTCVWDCRGSVVADVMMLDMFFFALISMRLYLETALPLNICLHICLTSSLGIAGDVTIDEHGDRDSDYSLKEMNKDTGEFEVRASHSVCPHHRTQFCRSAILRSLSITSCLM